MTPKEKARDLVDKYFNVGDQEFDYSKEFALIAVDEVLNSLEENRWQNRLMMDYWEEIKQEIELL